MNVIGLTGYAQVGKDTAAAGLIERGWERRAFADALRDVAYDSGARLYTDNSRAAASLREIVDALGWDAAKTHRDVRRYLQHLGVAARTHLGEDVWVRAAGRTLDHDGNYVITDCRFPNEADWVRQWGGVVVRIDRPGVGPVNGHVSEQRIAADVTVLNDGTPRQLATAILDAVNLFSATG